MKHILSYTEKMLLETVINFDSDFEQSIKSVFKGSDYEYIINDLLKLKDKDIDVKSNKNAFLIKGNVGINSVNITNKDSMKFSKLIGLLVPNLTSNDIKNITDKWVGGVKQDLKEVKGDKIKYYYQIENTEDISDTELKDSCMIDKDKSLLDIYTENTDNIKLLIKLNEDNKLTTRALLFNTIEKGWVMSRVYFNRPSEKVEFENYAKDNDITILTTKRDWSETLTVQLDNSKFDKYPYLDHFQYLNLENKQLSTTYEQWKGNDDTIHQLRKTNGGFKVIQKGLTLNGKFIKACGDNNIELVKELLKDERVDPSYNDSYAFWVSGSGNGYDKVVELLLKDGRADPSANDNEAIRIASKSGCDKVVELLLKDDRVDPSDVYNYAIRMASRNGHDKVVELLLKDKRVDPSDDDNYAIRWASENGHDKVVELLAQNDKVIQKAKQNNDTETLKILKKYGSITERKRYR